MEYTAFVHSRIKWMASHQENFVHAAMGLLGEAIELKHATDTENLLEELGDLEFYAEHASLVLSEIDQNHIQVSVPRVEAHELARDPTYWLIHHCADFHDQAKKAWVYNKPFTQLNFMDPLIRIRICLHFLAATQGKMRGDIQDMNQAKLEKRYPSGYSDAAAQARADKLEA